MILKYILKLLLIELIIIFNQVNSLSIKSHKTLNNDESFDLKDIPIDLIEHANTILKYMDTTANPCDNFHIYACGNWQKHHSIPDDKESYDIFGKLNDKLRESLHEILEIETNILNRNNDEDDEENNYKNNVRIFFESCIDIDKINEVKTKPLLDFLKKLGGCPLLDENWSEENFNLEKILADLSLYDMESFIHFSVGQNLHDADTHVIYINNILLGLTNYADYLEAYNKPHLDAYQQYIIEIFRLLKVDENQIEQAAKDIIQLEIKLANVSDTSALKYSDVYNVMTIVELQVLYPKFNWQYYLEIGFEKQFNNDTKVALWTGPNISKQYDIIFSTDKKLLANYFNWNAIKKLVDILDDDFKEPLGKLNLALTGTKKEVKRRALRCATETNEYLGIALSSLYIKKHFNENSRAEILKIAREIIHKFIENLYTIDWLDNETRLVAERKAKKTILGLGYPNYLLNTTYLNEYYKKLQLQPGKYFENIVNLRKFFIFNNIEKLDEDTKNSKQWVVNPTVINAFFENPKNRIIVPAAVLQPPVYHKSFPNAINYGAIGSFIGHELTHGFDSNGRTFDENGNIKDWWSSKSFDEFSKREKCFIDYYDQFSMHNKSLNGDLTKQENIADNGGMQLSYMVFKNWLNKQNEDVVKKTEVLPGLEFLSPEQLFFLSYAQSWCDYIRPEAVENRLAVDGHPPGMFRILGTLQNFNEFSRAYQCPENSNMNPIKKCKLW